MTTHHMPYAALLFALFASSVMAQVAAKSGSQPSTLAASSSIPLIPPKTDGPVVVRASFHLLSITGIDDEAETVDFSGVLRLVWKDARQAFDPKSEGVGEKVFSGDYQVDEISPSWYPQVTLVNAAGRYEGRAVLLRIAPDGTNTLTQAVDASARVNLNMRRYPFDRQELQAVFDVLGFDANEVRLDTTPNSASAPVRAINVPQWTFERIGASIVNQQAFIAGGMQERASFVVTMHINRQSLFVLRLVVIPLALIVVLSWSVFWMDRSSLGDRMSVSFVGILTAVAYQITLGGILPHVSYVTLMHGFLNISMAIMAATVAINLIVGACDRRGKTLLGDRIDLRCRLVFPLTYLGLNATALAVAIMFF